MLTFPLPPFFFLTHIVFLCHLSDIRPWAWSLTFFPFLWSLCFSSSFVYFKNVTKYLPRVTTQVFIALMRFLLQRFRFRKVYLFLWAVLFPLSSRIVWCLLPILPYIYYSPFVPMQIFTPALSGGLVNIRSGFLAGIKRSICISKYPKFYASHFLGGILVYAKTIW